MWQTWYSEDPTRAFVAVAVDAQGPSAARPWVGRAGATYPVAVDVDNQLGAALGYTMVPTGILVDDRGAVRHLQAGDYTVNREHTRLQAARFLDGDLAVLEELTSGSGVRLNRIEQELVDAKVRLARQLLEVGNEDDALSELDRALEIDPENFVIRKQRWHIRYPERFEPTIDSEWQERQLVRELEAERIARESSCGPDGCPIP